MLGNLSCTTDAEFMLEAFGKEIPKAAEATLVYSDDIRAHNTFEILDNITPSKLKINLNEPIVIPKAGILAIRF